MDGRLLILVAAETNMRHVVSLTKAACKRGKRVNVLFSGRGVNLIRDPGFREIEDKAHISICEASFREYGLDDLKEGIPERTVDRLTTHAQHAELLAQAERYVVL